MAYERHADDARAVANLDEAFHTRIVAAVGNDEMTRIQQDIAERIRIIRRLDFTKTPRIAANYDE